MRKLALLMAVVAITACDKSKPELEKTLVQVQSISAEKDSLLRDVMATTQFIADANTELSKVRTSASGKPKVSMAGETEGKLSPAQQRVALLARIKGITVALNEADSRLAASRKRVSMLDTSNASLKVQIAAYDSTITSMKAIIENQKVQVLDLTAQITALQAENTQLKASNVALTVDKGALIDEKVKLTTEKNTVYYVIGTKEELLKKKIIVQTGGMMGIGKVQVAARDLNPADFTSIDRTAVASIPLPNPEKNYKIVTRQDVAALQVQPDEKGRIKTAIAIKDAGQFWGASKFLIIIEQ